MYVGICIDGVPSMARSIKGFISLAITHFPRTRRRN